ncbi:25961_t:CDS:1, partial [Gigaspora rosea]
PVLTSTYFNLIFTRYQDFHPLVGSCFQLLAILLDSTYRLFIFIRQGGYGAAMRFGASLSF